MMYRRSSALVFVPEGDEFTVLNYVTGSEFGCAAPLVSFLSGLDRWQERGAVRAAAVARFGEDEADEVIDTLVDLDCITAQGSDTDCGEKLFNHQWKWGIGSAIFHQCLLGREMVTIEEQVAAQEERAAERSLATLTYEPAANATALHRLPDPDTKSGLFAAFAKRRTVREGVAHTVSLETLSDILYAGLGITGWTENSVQRLPLKYAPSGGARNPFDGYVYVTSVEGLKRGLYRYSGVSHTLEPVRTKSELSHEAILSGQDWAACGAATILLVADFGRSMWKYEGDDNAYRVVMIEAGHIAQNMMLMAADAGLSLCPSAALDHNLVSDAIGNDRFDRSPVYGLVVTKPG